MKKIVILENYEFLALKMQRTLNEYGYNNISIISKVDKYETNIKKILEEASVIIADLDNHNYDPIELLKKHGMEVPIIFINETGGVDKVKRIIKAGGKAFLLKPFETELFISKMAKIFHEDENFNNMLNKSEIFDKTQISLDWNTGFEIGISQIDIEHKSIIDNYKRLYNVMKEGDGLAYYPELLEFLQNYIGTHFVNEEKLQKEVGYVDYENHKKLHDNFSRTINEYIQNEKKNGASYRDLVTISLFIKDWMVHHILIEDRKIGEFIDKQEKNNE